MTIEEAIMIAVERNGRPQEDDWELAQASKVLTVALAQSSDRLGEATGLLRAIKEEPGNGLLPSTIGRISDFLN